jgi:hypothetical protein
LQFLYGAEARIALVLIPIVKYGFVNVNLGDTIKGIGPAADLLGLIVLSFAYLLTFWGPLLRYLVVLLGEATVTLPVCGHFWV